MNIIHKDCDIKLESDKSLPTNSYVISYETEGRLCYDIVQSSSKVEIFDYYYDQYKNIKNISWTDGKINPKTYRYTKPEKKKK